MYGVSAIMGAVLTYIVISSYNELTDTTCQRAGMYKTNRTGFCVDRKSGGVIYERKFLRWKLENKMGATQKDLSNG